MTFSNAVSVFTWLKGFLEQLFPDEFFDQGRTDHPAYRRWRLATEAVRHSGNLPNPLSQEMHFLLATTILDSVLLANLTGGVPQRLQLGSWDVYGDASFDRFRQSRLVDPDSFLDLMVELNYGAWHLMHGNRPNPLEVEGQADLVVDLPDFARQLVAECKRLRSVSENRVNSVVKKANNQIKARNREAVGVLVVDITEGGESADASQETPKLVRRAIARFRRALSGRKNRSVGAAIITWDWLEVVPGMASRIETRLLRKWQRIDHSEPRVSVPPALQLYEGYTVYSAYERL